MKTIVHRADTRGHADHGWLDSHHSFSFANYFNPERMNFGLLRVLNDDIVAPGRGFGTHPHDNMEIVSIPLRGDLEHKDSTGKTAVIRQNDVQIMSAGSGLTHSEYNHSKDKEVNFLQIWVFPKVRDITPRYDQRSFPPEGRVNQLQLVVAPNKEEDAVRINQDAYFSLGTLKPGFETTYELYKPGNVVYAFVIEGDLTIAGESLERRDAVGISDTGSFSVKAAAAAELLLIEVPDSH